MSKESLSSEPAKQPNYTMRRLGAAGAAFLAVAAASWGIAKATETHELSSMSITVDSKDSDGNTIPHSGDAAIEDICNATFEQADTLKIFDESSRQRLGESCVAAAQHAIGGESDRSLIGNSVEVSIKTDSRDRPFVAVARQK